MLDAAMHDKINRFTRKAHKTTNRIKFIKLQDGNYRPQIVWPPMQHMYTYTLIIGITAISGYLCSLVLTDLNCFATSKE